MKTNLPANPLQRLLQAATKTPRETGESARFRARRSPAGTAEVILLDTSSSMADRAGARRRIDHLREALAQVVQPQHVLIAFSSAARRIYAAAELPEPSGGTALEAGFAQASLHNPCASLVISDGEPTLPDLALAAAEKMPGRIDVIYCGDEANTVAVEFMRRLAKLGCGQYASHSWVTSGAPQLAATMQRMLLTHNRA
jgi:hypothetical protein